MEDGMGCQSGEQLRPRFCNVVRKGVRGPLRRVSRRLFASAYMADWALRASDPSAYRSSGSRMNKNARGVTCVAQFTQLFRTERRSVGASSPPGRWGRSLVPALHEVGMEDLCPRRLLDRDGQLQRCAWIH